MKEVKAGPQVANADVAPSEEETWEPSKAASPRRRFMYQYHGERPLPSSSKCFWKEASTDSFDAFIDTYCTDPFVFWTYPFAIWTHPCVIWTEPCAIWTEPCAIWIDPCAI